MTDTTQLLQRDETMKDNQKAKRFKKEWAEIQERYPMFAQAHLMQQTILAEAALRGDHTISCRMASLIERGAVLLFLGFWQKKASEVASFTKIFGTGNKLIDCLLEARDPGECFELSVERDWFDDPFDYHPFLPEKPEPPKPPLDK